MFSPNIEAPTSTVRVEGRHATIESRPAIAAPTSTVSVAVSPVLDERIKEQVAKALRLSELLDRITPENSHGDVFSDGPVGNEEW